MRLQHLLLIVVCGAINGCAVERPIDVESLRGPLESVVKVNRLEQYDSWPLMNLSPDEDHGTTYFLDKGNLTLRYFGDPPVVRNAEFWPSDKSAARRHQEANAAWADWVKAHTPK